MLFIPLWDCKLKLLILPCRNWSPYWIPVRFSLMFTRLPPESWIYHGKNLLLLTIVGTRGCDYAIIALSTPARGWGKAPWYWGRAPDLRNPYKSPVIPKFIQTPEFWLASDYQSTLNVGPIWLTLFLQHFERRNKIKIPQTRPELMNLTISQMCYPLHHQIFTTAVGFNCLIIIPLIKCYKKQVNLMGTTYFECTLGCILKKQDCKNSPKRLWRFK